jgi:hypothetical protein
MPSDPALSTQMRTGKPRHVFWSAARHISGPTSSRADIFLHSLHLSVCLAPELIFCPHGTKNQKRPPMPPVLWSVERAEPPDTSVKYSRVYTGKIAGLGVVDRPVEHFSITHQK